MLKNALKTLDPYLNDTLILSVSTGVDSMVLLRAIRELTSSVVVVHFNHQKRDAANIEASYLKDYCATYEIPYEYFILDVVGDNFQDEARKLRMMYLEQTADKYETKYILTAHHLNDLAETILMKISRGSNLYGYSGLQFRVEREHYVYLKPFLTVKKETLYEYAKIHEITFFEDVSNASDDYTRNRYRNKVIDVLVEENPQFLEKALQYSNHLYEAFSYIRAQSKNYLDENKHSLFLTSFFKTDLVIQKDIIALMMEQKNIPFNQLKIEAILTFLKTSGPNQAYPLTKTLVLQKSYQKVTIQTYIERSQFRQALDLDAFNVLGNMGNVTFLGDTGDISGYEIKLCYNKFALPLWARHRESGDILEFDYGHKKLKDYYIDKKIPLYQRDKDIILTDNNNRILAVLGRYYNQSPDLTSSIKLKYKRGLL